MDVEAGVAGLCDEFRLELPNSGGKDRLGVDTLPRERVAEQPEDFEIGERHLGGAGGDLVGFVEAAECDQCLVAIDGFSGSRDPVGDRVEVVEDLCQRHRSLDTRG